jgi:leucyl-tRNA---protein transferase
MSDPQTISHWPTWPLPVRRPVTMTGKHPCGYLENRLALFRAFDADEPAGSGIPISGPMYQKLMDAGFRRSGSVVYQPMCGACRACIPVRVPVDKFAPTKSQRRVMRKNTKIIVTVATPNPTREKWELYDRYQREWHRKVESDREDIASYVAFLYHSPIESLEFEYRDPWGKLLGVGICDITPTSLSSVYFYFDPTEAFRSIGTYSALYEIQWARQMKLKYWYAGYWVKGCATMEYKTRFGPYETLDTDGIWREARGTALSGR